MFASTTMRRAAWNAPDWKDLPPMLRFVPRPFQRSLAISASGVNQAQMPAPLAVQCDIDTKSCDSRCTENLRYALLDARFQCQSLLGEFNAALLAICRDG